MAVGQPNSIKKTCEIKGGIYAYNLRPYLQKFIPSNILFLWVGGVGVYTLIYKNRFCKNFSCKPFSTLMCGHEI